MALVSGGVLRAFDERGGVVAFVVGDDVMHGLGGELVLALEVGGGDGRQGDHPGDGREVAVAEVGVEVGADEEEAVDADTELRLEVVRDARAAVAAVALAHDVLLGHHALVFDEPLVDGEGEVLDVRGGGVEEFFAFVVGDEGLGEAGADGVDEDEVGEVEPGAGVVGEGGGVGGGVAGVAEGDVLGADGAEVEEAGGGAGAAVEGEHHGAVVCAVEGIGGVDDFGGGLAVLALHGDGADGGGVVEGLAVDGDGLFDGLVGGEWVGEGLGVFGWFGSAGRRSGCAGGGGGCGC